MGQYILRGPTHGQPMPTNNFLAKACRPKSSCGEGFAKSFRGVFVKTTCPCSDQGDLMGRGEGVVGAARQSLGFWWMVFDGQQWVMALGYRPG